MLTNCFVYVGEISGNGGEAEQALLKCSGTRYVHVRRECFGQVAKHSCSCSPPLLTFFSPSCSPLSPLFSFFPSLLSLPLSPLFLPSLLFLLSLPLFLLYSPPSPSLSLFPSRLLNFSKPVATSVSVNHLYGYCWEEDDGEADLQWCRALVVAVRKNEVHVCLASFPGSCAGEEERERGTHCSRMRQVPLVTCILCVHHCMA